jgi:hypothetical protein
MSLTRKPSKARAGMGWHVVSEGAGLVFKSASGVLLAALEV